MPDIEPNPYVGILLAAGRGKRFDVSGRRNKLLAPCGSGSVVSEAARHLLAVLPEVIAVVRANDHETARVLKTAGCRVSFCSEADQGMSASLQQGLACAAGANGWVIALGDMPYVQPDTLRALTKALDAGADIAAPVHQGKRGNPVAFGRTHLPALMQLRGDQGARHLLAASPLTLIPVNDPGILFDIDTAADLGTPSTETSR